MKNIFDRTLHFGFGMLLMWMWIGKEPKKHDDGPVAYAAYRAGFMEGMNYYSATLNMFMHSADKIPTFMECTEYMKMTFEAWRRKEDAR